MSETGCKVKTERWAVVWYEPTASSPWCYTKDYMKKHVDIISAVDRNEAIDRFVALSGQLPAEQVSVLSCDLESELVSKAFKSDVTLMSVDHGLVRLREEIDGKYRWLLFLLILVSVSVLASIVFR